MTHEDDPVVLESAHRHGVTDDDALHAYAYAMYQVAPTHEGFTMYIGPSRDGTATLEIGLLSNWHGIRAIAHAMPARKKFLR